jgi:hypothetical protein
MGLGAAAAASAAAIASSSASESEAKGSDSEAESAMGFPGRYLAGRAGFAVMRFGGIVVVIGLCWREKHSD